MIGSWPAFDVKIARHIAASDGTVKHISEITNMSATNRRRVQENLSVKHAMISELEETARFPVQMLPSRQNNLNFLGRKAELEKINKALDWKNPENNAVRAYVIYGRRGVGKTELALEYSYSNPAGFDAIFWVECETNFMLRQSFTDMAKAVNLPTADRCGMRQPYRISSGDYN